MFQRVGEWWTQAALGTLCLSCFVCVLTESRDALCITHEMGNGMTVETVCELSTKFTKLKNKVTFTQYIPCVNKYDVYYYITLY